MTAKQVLERLRDEGFRVDFPQVCYLIMKGHVPVPAKDASGRRVYTRLHLSRIKAALERRRR